MNTAEAVLQLRREFEETQPRFAKMLGVSFRSLCRYEAGGEPSAKVLKKLIELAKQKNLPHLENIFSAMQQGEIVSRVKRVTSGRSRVRVEISDLSRWARIQGEVFYCIDKVLSGRMKWEDAKQLLNTVAGMVDSVKDQMEPYLTAPDFEQLQRLREFDALTAQRAMMDGTVDLKGSALAPNVEVIATDKGVTLHVKSAHTSNKHTDNHAMHCKELERLKKHLTAAMEKEDRTRALPAGKARVEEQGRTKAAVRQADLDIKWHIRDCTQCQAETAAAVPAKKARAKKRA